MPPVARKLLSPFASLRLTVALMAIGMFLIFAGTLAQVDADIWTVMKEYFRTWYVMIPVQIFFPRSLNVGDTAIPWPGGWAIAIVLVTNLLAAHFVRFKFTWQRSGILLIHSGLILLIVGEVVTGVYAHEADMTITEGSYANFTEDRREMELVVIDPSDPDIDRVTVIRENRFVGKNGSIIKHPDLPFDIRVERYFVNSSLYSAPPDDMTNDLRATDGYGATLHAEPEPSVPGTGNLRNVPTGFITLSHGGETVGTYMVSLYDLHFAATRHDDGVRRTQVVTVDGKPYHIDLRFRREYKDYKVFLADFRHDRYTGTNVPRNYSSQVRLVDDARGVDREVLIWMNHPLRYHGDTFYQSAFKDNDTTTVLQVVRNPGWLMPYVAVILGGVGLIVHFLMRLARFLRSREDPGRVARSAATTSQTSVVVSWVVLMIFGVYAVSTFRAPKDVTDFNLREFGKLPVSADGRIKPLDSLARTNLMIISRMQSIPKKNAPPDYTRSRRAVSAVQWMLEVIINKPHARHYRIFYIADEELISLLKLDANRKHFRYAFDEVIGAQENRTTLFEQIHQAGKVPDNERDRFQRHVMDLSKQLRAYQQIADAGRLHLVPPDSQRPDWEQLEAAQPDESASPLAVRAYVDMLQAYDQGDAASFNTALTGYQTSFRRTFPAEARRVSAEHIFNQAAPFYTGMVLYVIVAMCVFGSWLKWPGVLISTANKLLMLTLVLHTLGIIVRIYLSGRPPVTNLYASAVFIGWGVTVLCVILERLFRNSMGTLVASISGFTTLLIAHNLAHSGDTMAVLQAVLDTNFWLATHVVVITLGYASTFLAGLLAIVYILRGVFTLTLDESTAKSLTRMVYGIVCFAMLFSFVGTILGGIWADQSWGRFWGWDPKENGALLIVLWNALILHARWGGVVQARGMMVLAIFGNIVTSWSWFGTNMLGVGLHSYGFMDSAMLSLVGFVISQLLLMGVGMLPMDMWRCVTNPAVRTTAVPATDDVPNR